MTGAAYWPLMRLCVLALWLLVPAPAWADAFARGDDAAEIVGPPAPTGPTGASQATLQPRVIDRRFWLAAATLTAATVYDVESTYAVLGRCAGRCEESNRFQSGVIASGRAWTYGIQTALNVGVAYAGARARQSRHAAIRKTWWVPFVVVSWAHVAGGVLNSSERRPR